MKSYGQFCPVAKASEIFATRWTPLILRELLMGAHGFNEIEAGCPGIPRSLLSDRLRELERVGIVAREREGPGRSRYALTRAGEELYGIVVSLGEWGQRWANHEIGEKDANPRLLMWDMRRRLRMQRVPGQRVVVRFEFRGSHRDTIWLVIERPEPSVCFHDPGFETDLVVTADTLALHRVWMGRASLKSVMANGELEIEGPARLRRAFPGWLLLSDFAGIESAA